MMNSRPLIFSALALATLASAQVVPIDSIRRNNADGVPADSGRVVTVAGILTATSNFGTSGPAYIEDNTAGVAIYGSSVADFAIGDSVTVSATVDFYRGLTELKLPAITRFATGRTVTPRVLQAAHLGDTLNNREIYEGRLAQLHGIFNATGNFQGNHSYTFTDASGQTSVYIDSQVGDILNKPIPQDTIDLTGCVSQYDASSPYFSGYQILPRQYADVGGSSGSGVITIADAFIDADSNTVPDRLDEIVTVTGIVTMPSGVSSTTKTDIFIQDQTAGCNIYDYTYRDLKLGDSLVVTGTVTCYRGKPELTSPQIVHADSNHVVPEPIPTTCHDIEQSRRLLGRLVVVHGASATNLLVASGQNTLLDTSGSTTLFTTSPSGVAGLLLVPDTFSVVGIKSQYGPTSPPYNSGYELIPRFRSDFSRSMEDQPVMTIAEVQKPGPDGHSSKYEGQYVKVQGRVSGPSYVFTTGSSSSLYIQDATNGVNVYAPAFDSSVTGAYLDSVGALMECVGKVTEYSGLTELANGSIRLLSDTLRPYAPVEMPFNGFLTEMMESRLVTVTGDVITPVAGAGGGQNFTIKNGNAGIDVRVVDGAGIALNWVQPWDSVTLASGRKIQVPVSVQVTGIVGQYTSTYPFGDGYQLMPRFRSDLVRLAFLGDTALMRISAGTTRVFNPSAGGTCNISVKSPGDRKLYLQVFDLEGRMVKDLLVNVPGHNYDVTWDGTDNTQERLPIGTYILNLKGVRNDGRTEVKRELVVLGTKLH